MDTVWIASSGSLLSFRSLLRAIITFVNPAAVCAAGAATVAGITDGKLGDIVLRSAVFGELQPAQTGIDANVIRLNTSLMITEKHGVAEPQPKERGWV